MKNNVQSIERAFQILQAVHGRAKGIGIGSLAAETGLHTSTVSRIVSTLENLGALDRVNGKLFVGEAIVGLAHQAPWTEQLISIANPNLRELATLTREAVGLTIIDDDECFVFYQIPSPHHIQIRDWTGERFPLHVTSTGKLYYAHLAMHELEVMLLQQPLRAFASQTRINMQHLIAEIPQIKRDGVAWTEDELEDGLTSVAAPIYDDSNEFAAAVYISIPNYRVNDKLLLAQQISETAMQISKSLGYTPKP